MVVKNPVVENCSLLSGDGAVPVMITRTAE